MFDHTDPTRRLSSYELERWAHHERNLVIQAYLWSAAGSIATSLNAVIRVCGRLVRRLADEQRARSDIRALQRFDDRTLADIGLRRDEIDYIVRNGRPAPHKARIAETHPSRKPRLVTVTENVGTRTSPVKVATVTIFNTATMSRR
jgi:uncharacterized protein YjiS (DUF1127 family)